VRVKSLGFRTDLALRALEGAAIDDRGDYLVIRSPDNPDFWWGNFLLLRDPPRTGGTWLTRFAAEFPTARHVAIGVDTAEDQIATPEEFLAAGLEPERATVLTAVGVRPPPHPNTDAEIRFLDSDADWRQSVDLAVRCFGVGEPGDYLDRRAAAQRRLTEEGTGAWFGAFVGGRLVAQLGLFDAGDGYARYQHVETDPAARRQGLAGTLVWHAGRYGREVLHARTLVIVADPADVAIRVYCACGLTDRESQFSFARPST
jgi:hypothetical protein